MVDVDTRYIIIQLHCGYWLCGWFLVEFPRGHNILLMICCHLLSGGFEPATAIQRSLFFMRKQLQSARVSQYLCLAYVNDIECL